MSELVLVHHGIKGQRWGERNGPPYPLDQNDMSVAERKADTGKTDKKNVKVNNPGYRSKTEMADYKNMDKDELKDLVERMELENRYLRAMDARKGKSFLEQAATTATRVGTLLENTNKTIQFITGRNFAQNLGLDETFKGLTKKLLEDKSISDKELKEFGLNRLDVDAEPEFETYSPKPKK